MDKFKAMRLDDVTNGVDMNSGQRKPWSVPKVTAQGKRKTIKGN